MTSSHTRAPIESLLYLISPNDKRKALEYLLQITDENFRPIVRHKLDVTIAIERNPNEVFSKICACIRAVMGVGDFENSPTKFRDEVFARQMAGYFMLLEYREVPGFGLKKIGALFNPIKHHATIIHSRKIVENLFLTDKTTETTVTNIAECLNEFGISEPLHLVKQLKSIKDDKNKKRKGV